MNELEDLKKLLEETKNKGFPEVIAIHPEVYNYWMHDKRTTKERFIDILKHIKTKIKLDKQDRKTFKKILKKLS